MPMEIVLAILSFVDKSDLCRLLTICKAFYEVALDRIYQSIDTEGMKRRTLGLLRDAFL